LYKTKATMILNLITFGFRFEITILQIPTFMQISQFLQYWFVILDSPFLFLYFYFRFKINDPKNYIKFSKFFCDFDSYIL